MKRYRKLKIPPELILQEMQQVAELIDLQKTLPTSAYIQYGLFSVTRIINLFGTWNKALACAGLKSFDPQTRIKNRKRFATRKLRFNVMARDNFRCVLCGRSAKDGIILHIDHIIPFSKGGETIQENLQTLCHLCNYGKGART